ncbi:MAG: hypothetical protein ACK4YP_16270 [Myxococcota bacterium]
MLLLLALACDFSAATGVSVEDTAAADDTGDSADTGADDTDTGGDTDTGPDDTGPVDPLEGE